MLLLFFDQVLDLTLLFSLPLPSQKNVENFSFTLTLKNAKKIVLGSEIYFWLNSEIP